MQLLSADDFVPWVGRKVRINTVPKPVEVTLESIERRPALLSDDYREPFSLFFESPMDVYLIDAIYQFDCGRGGPYDIHISQLVPRQGRRRYQAGFS